MNLFYVFFFFRSHSSGFIIIQIFMFTRVISDRCHNDAVESLVNRIGRRTRRRLFLIKCLSIRAFPIFFRMSFSRSGISMVLSFCLEVALYLVRVRGIQLSSSVRRKINISTPLPWSQLNTRRLSSRFGISHFNARRRNWQGFGFIVTSLTWCCGFWHRFMSNETLFHPLTLLLNKQQSAVMFWG